MKQLHLNFWNMEKDTLAFFDDNPSEWIKNLFIKNNVDKLRANEASLDLANKTQKDKNPVGHTSQKDLQKKKMIKLGYKLCCKIASYAMEKDDKILLIAVDFTEAKLAKGSESKVVSRCEIIADKADENLGLLADVNVTAEEIANFRKNIETFKQMPVARDLVANERKGAVKSIGELIAEARQLLTKLDNNVDGMIETPSFVTGYHQIRAINSRRGSRNTTKNNNSTPAK